MTPGPRHKWTCADCTASGWAFSRSRANEELAFHIRQAHNSVPWMEGDE